MGDIFFLGLGEIEGKINAIKNQRGLNQAFVLARGIGGVGGVVCGEISALQAPGLTFLFLLCTAAARNVLGSVCVPLPSAGGSSDCYLPPSIPQCFYRY